VIIKPIASSSAGNCHYISDGKTSLLLDCGIPIDKIRIALDFKLSEVAGCLLTHEHKDHSKAFEDILKSRVQIFALYSTIVACRPKNPACTMHAIDEVSEFSIGTFRVRHFPVEHDVPNTGYLIRSSVTKETLVYFTDTAYLSFIFPQVDYIMGEINYSVDTLNAGVAAGKIPVALRNRIVKSHMELHTFLDWLKACREAGARPKQIYLLHLSDSNSRADDFKRDVQRLTGCEVYLC